jgi:hypothetical protein
MVLLRMLFAVAYVVDSGMESVVESVVCGLQWLCCS